MYGKTFKNHKEADTLLTHYITSSKLDAKPVWVCVSDVDVTVLQIAHRNLFSCINVYFGINASKTNFDSLLKVIGSECAKCLLAVHCLTGCYRARKFSFFQVVMDKIISIN